MLYECGAWPLHLRHASENNEPKLDRTHDPMPLTQKVSAGPPSFARRLLDLAVRQRERIIQGISLTDHRHAFAACALISSIVGIILIYVASAYLEIGSMGQMFSYRPDDIPGGLWPEMYPPPLGVHYFGDFLDTVRHSQVESPFTTPGMSPTGYPLFSLIVLAPFGLPSYRVALVLFLVITALVLLIPVWCSLRERPFAERLILLSPIVVCAPFLAVLDRGNIQGFVVGSALFGLLAYLRDNRTTAGVLFGLSAAMKIYPVVLILLLVRQRDWRAVGVSAATGATATIAGFMVYGGQPIDNLRLLWDSIHLVRSDAAEHLLFYNHSFKGGLAALGVWPGGRLGDAASWTISQYEAILVLCLIALVILVTNRAVPLLSAVTYIAIFVGFGTGISFPYQALFLLLVVVVVYTMQETQSPARFIAMLAVAGMLAPKGIPMGSGAIPLFAWVDPTLGLITVSCLLFDDLRMLATARRERSFGIAKRSK